MLVQGATTTTAVRPVVPARGPAAKPTDPMNPKPTSCPSCGGPGGVKIGKAVGKCQDCERGRKPAGTCFKPAGDTSPPETIKDLLQAPASNVGRLQVEISGFTFANNTKRVVTLCPASSAAALKEHIEAFKP